MASSTSSLPATTNLTSLRRTFKYTSDADMSATDERDELDETEQEDLIASLSASNDTTNLFYARVFTAVPLVAMLPFLYHLLAFRATRLTFLPALLGVTSLLASAFTMGFVPVEGVGGAGWGGEGVGRGNGVGFVDGEGYGTTKTGGMGKGRSRGSAGGAGATLSDVAHAQASRRRAAHALGGGQLGVELPFVVPVDVQGPLGKYLQVVNAIVGAVLVVFAVLLVNSEASGQGFWLLLLLPGVIVAVVAVVRGAMGETERGLRELGGLRYDYKGA